MLMENAQEMKVSSAVYLFHIKSQNVKLKVVFVAQSATVRVNL